ncbi:MAG: nucleotidyl transferase AbiEii/AbiGii toxin family protein, partial [Cyclobacteriaceae bacterium]|nr:nucleotidyl transferase AbiEii/AbiGii toxin family protein [Cyclobacteriaceae bacterium]
MLYQKAVEPNTLSLLKKLQQIPELYSFYLVGGTALALKFGHRISIDIDLFGEKFNKELIINALQEEFSANFIYENTPNKWAVFCYINNIKVDI